MHFPLKLRMIIYSLLASVGWFLLLPFPFQGAPVNMYGEYAVSWHLLGGFHLLERSFGGFFITDGIQLEMIDGKYSYSSHTYLLIFLIISIALGGITYLLLEKIKAKKAMTNRA